MPEGYLSKTYIYIYISGPDTFRTPEATLILCLAPFKH